jgi:2-iminobutanoate/2-iminopropanoate deaminase
MTCCCKKKVIFPENAAKPIAPYSPGIKAGRLIFTSGQLGVDPQSGNILTGGVEAETRQAIQNIQSVLAATGANLTDVVKTTVFLRDINDFARMNMAYGEFFKEDPPARSAFQVAALPKGAAVEIEAIAQLPCKKCLGKSDCHCGDDCHCEDGCDCNEECGCH